MQPPPPPPISCQLALFWRRGCFTAALDLRVVPPAASRGEEHFDCAAAVRDGVGQRVWTAGGTLERLAAEGGGWVLLRIRGDEKDGWLDTGLLFMSTYKCFCRSKCDPWFGRAVLTDSGERCLAATGVGIHCGPVCILRIGGVVTHKQSKKRHELPVSSSLRCF